MSNESVFVIAEIGINHNGDMNLVKKLIDMAKESGCGAVKFQKRTIELVYSQEVLSTPRESRWGTTTRQQKEGLELSQKDYDEIDRYCKEVGIDWFASAWDIPSQEFLGTYNLKYNKVASAMLTHWEFVEHVAKEQKLTFVSTGMSTLHDLDRAVKIFRDADCPFVLMHAVSVYPCRDDECNLLVMKALQQRYNCRVGYSGHEVGVLPSIVAACLGAEVIERHITLDRAMYGSDQAASLERRGIEIVARDCKAIKAILGSAEKTVSEGEKAVAKKLRYFLGNI